MAAVRDWLDSIRVLPRGDERVYRMNTLLRTLGQPETFATFLDMMRYASQQLNSAEADLTAVSQKSSKHAVYGWCGQTRLALSSLAETPNTLPPELGVQAFLGKTPTAAWSLSMHIWQPNLKASGFRYGRPEKPGIIAEPPHSHPFDFASIVVTGEMHQSVYRQRALGGPEWTDQSATGGRYNDMKLAHVHGVWPPHDGQQDDEVQTLENRVRFEAGDSYYMAANMIHDVQVDAETAQLKPAITLFLRSESYTSPHVYMAPAMAHYHKLNPELKSQGQPLSETAWHKKLELVADYLRGERENLSLSGLVNYDSDYAFFHR